MTGNAEVLRQHQAHKAAIMRIFGAGRREPPVNKIAPPVVIDTKPKHPAPKLVWVRQYNEHIIAFRRWQLAEETGREYVPRSERPDANAIIMEVLADFPGVTIDEIKGPRRQVRLVRPRQIAMYEVCKQRPDMSYPQIGRFFGGRDHTTCLHAVRKISQERGPARGNTC
jgi:hypothetical protein